MQAKLYLFNVNKCSLVSVYFLFNYCFVSFSFQLYLHKACFYLVNAISKIKCFSHMQQCIFFSFCKAAKDFNTLNHVPDASSLRTPLKRMRFSGPNHCDSRVLVGTLHLRVLFEPCTHSVALTCHPGQSVLCLVSWF